MIKMCNIFRYHNERMINYDKHRLVVVTKDRTGSTLTIQNASSETDSGNYTCSPDKVRPASVTVHVLRQGNSAAAVQNNERSSSSIRYVLVDCIYFCKTWSAN